MASVRESHERYARAMLLRNVFRSVAGRFGRRRLVATMVVVAIMVGPAPSSAGASTPSGFRIIPSPRIDGGYLYSVSASSSWNAWAVGEDSWERHGLVLRWHSGQWTRFSTPYDDQVRIWRTVVTTSSKTVWLYGDTSTSPVDEIFLVRWNGVSFTRIPVPAHNYLGSAEIAALSPTDLWMTWVSLVSPTQSVWGISHWNGTAWQEYASCGGGIDMVSHNDVWTTGGCHWNGTGMQEIPSSDSNAIDFPWTVMIEGTGRWDGSDWGLIPMPQRPNDVISFGATEAWSVGQRQNSQGQWRTLIEHYVDGAWHDLGGPNASIGPSQLEGGTRIPGTATGMWAVGIGGGYPLILRHD